MRMVLMILACCFSLSAGASAQTIHAVLIGDTTDASIGVGITENLRKMRVFLQQAKSEGELNIVVSEVKDADFKPLPGSKIGELTANFEIVLGRTPDENAPPTARVRGRG